MRSASHCGVVLGLVGLVVGCSSDSGGASDAATGGTGPTGTATGVSTKGNTLSGTGNATASGGGTLDDTAGSADTVGTGPGTGTTTGSTGCVDNSDCTDPANPICVDDTCTTCDAAGDPDAACVMVSADTPACVGGVCVECSETVDSACGGNTPHCDAGTSTCVACTEHAHCPDTACKIPSSFSDANDAEDDEGSCFGGDVIDLTDADDLASAISTVPGNGEQVFRLADGSYNFAITIDNGKTVALLAATPGGATINPGDPGSSTITVAGAGDGTRFFLHGVDVVGNDNTSHAGLDVDNARLYAQRSRIVQNTGGALLAENGAYVDIENSFLAGPDVTIVDASASSVSLLYSTAFRGTNVGDPTLDCSLPAVAFEVTNSAIAGRASMSGNEIACVETELVGSYVASTLTPDDWFADYAAGDLHLVAGHPFGNVATWHDGDPVVDIDGDARPGVDGTSDVAGADVGP